MCSDAALRVKMARAVGTPALDYQEMKAASLLDAVGPMSFAAVGALAGHGIGRNQANAAAGKLISEHNLPVTEADEHRLQRAGDSTMGGVVAPAIVGGSLGALIGAAGGVGIHHLTGFDDAVHTGATAGAGIGSVFHGRASGHKALQGIHNELDHAGAPAPSHPSVASRGLLGRAVRTGLLGGAGIASLGILAAHTPDVGDMTVSSLPHVGEASGVEHPDWLLDRPRTGFGALPEWLNDPEADPDNPIYWE
jgi:hypothetical protein